MSNTGLTVGGGILLVILVVLLIAFGPLLFLWSLNTIFPVLAIPYSIKTWFAALVLGGAISRSAQAHSSKS